MQDRKPGQVGRRARLETERVMGKYVLGRALGVSMIVLVVIYFFMH